MASNAIELRSIAVTSSLTETRSCQLWCEAYLHGILTEAHRWPCRLLATINRFGDIGQFEEGLPVST
jgi:hypothetical protein